MEKKKKSTIKARLIALGVALALLAAAMGVTLWQYQKFTAAALPFDLTVMIVINCVGAAVIYLVVCHFLKKDYNTD